MHAKTSYLAAREGQLHLMHDALGSLAYPAEVPRDLPEELVPVASAQTHRRIIEAFGTLDRAARALDGHISYQLQQPDSARRRATDGAEAGLLTTARDALQRIPVLAITPLEIRARLEKAMARPTAPTGPAPAAPTNHGEPHTRALETDRRPGVHR